MVSTTEEQKEYNRQYYLKNKERIKAQTNKYYHNNKTDEVYMSKRRNTQRIYNRKLDTIKRTKNWIANNKERRNEISRDSYKKLKEIFDEKYRKDLICEHCGSINNIDHHHIDPSTKLFNVSTMFHKSDEIILAEISKCIPLCKVCHLKARNH